MGEEELEVVATIFFPSFGISLATVRGAFWVKIASSQDVNGSSGSLLADSGVYVSAICKHVCHHGSELLEGTIQEPSGGEGKLLVQIGQVGGWDAAESR